MIDQNLNNRLDNTTFRYSLYPSQEDGLSEIRMSVCGVKNGENQYKLVNTITKIFSDNVCDITQRALEQGIIVQIDDPDSSISGRWLVTSRKVGCLFFRILESILYCIKQWFPCFYTPPSGSIANVTISNIKGHCCEELIAKIRGATSFLHVPPALGLPDADRIRPIPQTVDEILNTPNFADPATLLSTTCLQSVEGPYLMEAKPNSDYYLSIEGTNLALKRIPKDLDDSYLEANRKALSYYVDFLQREFGLDFLTQIQETTGIDFGKMSEEGLPLTPDIVSRCNVCANNIELSHLEKIWHRLKIFKSNYKAIKKGSDPTYRELGSPLHDPKEKREYIVPWRVLRKLCCEELNDLVGNNPPASVQDLPPAKFNAVRALIESTPDELERAYTGRKIRHIAISGFITMGNPNRPNPSRCQAELLQIFEGLKKNWENFFELSAHVYSKKNLFRLSPDQRQEEWHVGTMIPGPQVDGNIESSYYTQAVVDDGAGGFSYVLAPSCTTYTLGERSLPWIKVYRSTNSNPNSPDWWTSMLADINNKGSPGSMDPDAAYVRERKELDKRSLPLWSAYLEAALILKNDPSKSTLTYSKAIYFAVDELEEYLSVVDPGAKFQIIHALRVALDDVNFVIVEEQLSAIAERYHERSDDKLEQDIYHIGHSLGAANAQLFTWHHFTKQRRVPMIGCCSYTVAFNGPAIDKEHDEEFMSFGREHKELFRLLGIRFSVQHQLEFGDVVPQGGECHLGTSGYSPEDDDWLEFSAYVFKPNVYEAPITATALPITTLQTHGRRIREAEEGEKKDYVVTGLSPEMLVSFHESWVLPSDLRQIFGYPLLISPYISEKMRHIAGCILMPIGKLLTPCLEIEPPVQSHDGVTYVEYARPQF